MRHLVTALSFAIFSTHAAALDLGSISNADASQGLKQALMQGAERAVTQLGQAGGFLDNPEVRIPLPESMQKAEKAMRMFGMGKQADELVLKMNQAAEAAVPEAKALLVNSVKQMSVQDAKDILTGGQDSATQYFRRTTSASMAEKFLPIVKNATQNVELAQQYNKFAEMGSKYGLVGKDQANIEQYVTQKALDGVYRMMAEEEKAIRQDPMGQASNLLKKVFSAVK
ncbi:DUF4197 domain-containing protein [Methylobacillus flagellatus]|uniref:DUF4197 domain-containing protein n=1 Tax=Methylobacillus flagellatus (strain ATCC 51484 / DSM 6875 / VKM B-1610 / KT) TaxID=265072 RepID=Q1H2J5_METFK|nr:DUF4197 domain-containing protein [Methylobacillus flagellatus]ABE49148.1 conserved hypothetical protein [Methylobacillus flagellatus KT]ABE49292.1 conserved hypothetical protein [Methylobacillus flagellatus KT]